MLYYKSTSRFLCVFLTLSGTFFYPSRLKSQSFTATTPTETGIYVGNLAWAGVNFWILPKHQGTPQAFQVPYIDNYQKNKGNLTLRTASDMGLWTAILAGGFAGISAAGNIDFRYQNVLLQNVMLTANLTQTVKLSVLRNRPATWNEPDDSYSFFSGHSSVSASMAATALYYAYRVPNAPAHAKILGWSSAGFSILTGILRIESGKHYPSDVLLGWAVGTGVALLNSYIHTQR